MRKKLLWCAPGLFVLLAILISAFHFFPAPAVANHLLVVRVASGKTLEQIKNLKGVVAAELAFPFSGAQEFRDVYKVEFKGGMGEIEGLKYSGMFKTVEPDYSVKATAVVVSDPKFTISAQVADQQWWLPKTKIPDAWDISRGSKDVTVAIVDTGIDGLHEDLNDGRVGAGYASYCQVMSSSTGQCIVHQDGTLPAAENSDDNGHGTIVAGIIGAIPNNGKGIAGINWQIRLLPIKVLDKSGTGVSSDVAAGIVWAADHGANIINMSLGGESLEGNSILDDAISYAAKAGVLVVAAAGNDGSLIGNDLDIEPVYPVCSDGGKNMVLGVAATDINDKKASFSNFGKACIDIAAPGTTNFVNRDNQKGIISTYFDPTQAGKNNLYVLASGTSMSAPIVTGVAALLKSVHPDLSAAVLRDRIINSAENIDAANFDACNGSSCKGKLGNGRLDALRALQAPTITAGSLIENPSGRIYLVEDGQRRAISDFVLTQRGYDKSSIKIVATVEEENLPLGQNVPPLDGTLVKAASLPDVYVVEKGILRPVSYTAFKSFSYSFGDVAVLPNDEIAGYAQGSHLIPRNGALIKLESQPAVYFIQDGKKRLLSAFSFRSRGLSFADVVVVGQREFDRYPSDKQNILQPPAEGSLVKSGIDPTVYVIEDGQRRALSAEVFQARGYKFSQVNVISQSEMDGYLLGPVL